MILFLLYQVVLAFESVDEILNYGHPKENYWVAVILSCGTVYYAVQGGSNFWVCVTIQVKTTCTEQLLCCDTVYAAYNYKCTFSVGGFNF